MEQNNNPFIKDNYLICHKKNIWSTLHLILILPSQNYCFCQKWNPAQNQIVQGLEMHVLIQKYRQHIGV